MSMTRPVLIIEDDPDIAEILRFGLENARLSAQVALTGEEGLSASLDKKNPPAAILLDQLLPGISGGEICRRLRLEAYTRRIPIIMVTAKSAEKDISAGLDMGADDYITKPFIVCEVVERVRSLIQRTCSTTTAIYDDGHLRIDFGQMLVFCNGRPIRLAGLDFALLAELAAHPGEVTTRQQLVDQVWGPNHHADARAMNVTVRRLRSIIGICGDVIEPVGGTSYRFVGARQLNPGVGGGRPDDISG
jgi:two-component system phosphate regulon response regulator PhoB